MITLYTSCMVLSDYRCIYLEKNVLLECYVASGPPALLCWGNADSLRWCLTLCKPGFWFIFPRGCGMDTTIPTSRRGSVSIVIREEWSTGPTAATVGQTVSLVRPRHSALCLEWWLKCLGDGTKREGMCVWWKTVERNIHIVFPHILSILFLTPLPQTTEMTYAF